MSLPIPSNTTCDIYRTGVAPPSAPASGGVPCGLRCDWRGGQEAGDREANAVTWTHVMLIAAEIDIRDGYAGQATFAPQDSVYIPDGLGTCFNVIFIELLQADTPNAVKRVYLDRQQPSWPMEPL